LTAVALISAVAYSLWAIRIDLCLRRRLLPLGRRLLPLGRRLLLLGAEYVGILSVTFLRNGTTYLLGQR
jgi:hypothetical protein